MRKGGHLPRFFPCQPFYYPQLVLAASSCIIYIILAASHFKGPSHELTVYVDKRQIILGLKRAVADLKIFHMLLLFFLLQLVRNKVGLMRLSVYFAVFRIRDILVRKRILIRWPRTFYKRIRIRTKMPRNMFSSLFNQKSPKKIQFRCGPCLGINQTFKQPSKRKSKPSRETITLKG